MKINTSISLAIAIALFPLAVVAARSTPSTGRTETVEASDAAWTMVAPGVFQRTLPGGEIIRQASGDGGRAFDLARLTEVSTELQARMRNARGNAERLEIELSLLDLNATIASIEKSATTSRTTNGSQPKSAFHDSRYDNVCNWGVTQTSDMDHTAYKLYDYANAIASVSWDPSDFSPPPVFTLSIGGFAKVTYGSHTSLKTMNASVPYGTGAGSVSTALAETNPAYPAFGCTIETYSSVSSPLACGQYSSFSRLKYCSDL